MLNPQEGGRLDAKRQEVILAKALDGIWPVGHACAAVAIRPVGIWPRYGGGRRVPQHSTAQA